MSKQDDGQLYARVGSDVKSDLADVANVNDNSISEETRIAVQKHIKEHRGERVERANIAKMSAWDMGSAAFFVGAIMSGTLSLAGEAMLVYTVAFALTGLLFWAMGQFSFNRLVMPERDRA